MDRFVTKREYVEAIQYTGDNEQDIVEALKDDDVDIEAVAIRFGEGIIDLYKARDFLQLEPTDFLVFHENNMGDKSLDVLMEKEFTDKYNEMTDDDEYKLLGDKIEQTLNDGKYEESVYSDYTNLWAQLNNHIFTATSRKETEEERRRECYSSIRMQLIECETFRRNENNFQQGIQPFPDVY